MSSNKKAKKDDEEFNGWVNANRRKARARLLKKIEGHNLTELQRGDSTLRIAAFDSNNNLDFLQRMMAEGHRVEHIAADPTLTGDGQGTYPMPVMITFRGPKSAHVVVSAMFGMDVDDKTKEEALREVMPAGPVPDELLEWKRKNKKHNWMQDVIQQEQAASGKGRRRVGPDKKRARETDEDDTAQRAPKRTRRVLKGKQPAVLDDNPAAGASQDSFGLGMSQPSTTASFPAQSSEDADMMQFLGSLDPLLSQPSTTTSFAAQSGQGSSGLGLNQTSTTTPFAGGSNEDTGMMWFAPELGQDSTAQSFTAEPNQVSTTTPFGAEASLDADMMQFLGSLDPLLSQPSTAPSFAAQSTQDTDMMQSSHGSFGLGLSQPSTTTSFPAESRDDTDMTWINAFGLGAGQYPTAPSFTAEPGQVPTTTPFGAESGLDMDMMRMGFGPDLDQPSTAPSFAADSNLDLDMLDPDLFSDMDFTLDLGNPSTATPFRRFE
ncbi:hypothetical protein QBC47DRAFT_397402 [Echria macrotheca]|uniref:Uncharacterized protein n=1 Tax=Echria macrotheca TaxID=438768 RepID=A0AAJ0BN95_9PEZI|nr:hypothetical protein QBC47DRAFT_397402 [Echria macrotheca]